jgi:hypothetical protein
MTRLSPSIVYRRQSSIAVKREFWAKWANSSIAVDFFVYRRIPFLPKSPARQGFSPNWRNNAASLPSL